MPCSDNCGNTATKPSSNCITCSGALKALVGTCQHGTNCAGVSYPVGHFVRVNEFPTKGVGNYVYAYKAMSCADKVSEVGILGAEQCRLLRGISVIIKEQPESALFYGAVATANGIVEGTEIKLGYTDADGKYWTLWSKGTEGGEIGWTSGEFDISGVLYTTGIAAQPVAMPDNGVVGSVIGAGNDAGTSMGILFATLPGATPTTYVKIGVYGSPVYNADDTTAANGIMAAIRDANGANIAGTTAILGYADATTRRAAMFNGRVFLGADARISRDSAAIGEIYLDGETLKVRIS